MLAVTPIRIPSLHTDNHDGSARSIPPAMDERLDQLRAWLETHFGRRDFAVTVASADASFRRYFRVTRGAESWIAMDAPPAKEDIAPYVRVAQMLGDIGVNAPRILALDPAQGFLLNTDLGSETYLTALADQRRAETLYSAAIKSLVRIQAQGLEHAAALPAYDDALLRREIRLFPEWFCERHLGLHLTDPEAAILKRVEDALVRIALEQPRVFVHRDYHSRNLMVGGGYPPGPSPGILDFQDAVHGPITYDLVSLLRDCYIAWPAERVRAWVDKYRTEAHAAGVAGVGEARTLHRWFDLMGVQRHMKAIGIFARLWHRDGKSGYLNDIPRTLGYVVAATGEHPELREFAELIAVRVQPALEQLRSQTR
jgi:N-acetylmuramate 1-kinase